MGHTLGSTESPDPGITRRNDYWLDWREATEEYKSELYRLLRDKMAVSLSHGWTVAYSVSDYRNQWLLCRVTVVRVTDGTGNLAGWGIPSDGQPSLCLLVRTE
jgi:hypothetical protein